MIRLTKIKLNPGFKKSKLQSDRFSRQNQMIRISKCNCIYNNERNGFKIIQNKRPI